jgi:hypothetical protein
MQMQMLACWLVGVVVGVVVGMLMLLMLLMLPMLPAREGPVGSCCSFLPWAAPSPPLTSVCFASHSQLGTGAAATAGAGPGDSRGGPAHSVHCMWGCLVRETEWLDKRLPESTMYEVCPSCVCAARRASLGLASPGITSHHITWHRITLHRPPSAPLGNQPRAPSSHGTLCSLRLLAAPRQEVVAPGEPE